MTELFAFVVLAVGAASAPVSDPNPPTAVATESLATAVQPTDSLDAVVLIARTSGRSVVRGSGVTIAEDQSAWYVLTNAHVAGRAGEQVQCVFFKQGYASRSVPGQVVWASYRGTATAGGDAAMVTVSKVALGNVQLAKADTLGSGIVQVAETIQSAGSPKASWPNMFRGHVLSVSQDLIKFVPQPLEGRSGSGLCDSSGKLIGLITWADGEEHVGYAQSWRAIRAVMEGRQPAAADSVDRNLKPCGLATIPWVEPLDPQPTQCPGGICPPVPDAPQPVPRPARPGRTPDAPNSDPWPGMPPELRRGPVPGPVPSPGTTEGDRQAEPPQSRDGGRFRDWIRGRDGQRPAVPGVEDAASLLGRRLADPELRQAVEQLARDAARGAADEVRGAIEPEKLKTTLAEVLREVVRSTGEEFQSAVLSLDKLQRQLDQLHEGWRKTNQALDTLGAVGWPAVVILTLVLAGRLIPWSAVSKWVGRARIVVSQTPPEKPHED